MMVIVIFRKIKSLLLSLLTLVKRCFCCLRRRRHSSENQLPISVSSGEAHPSLAASQEESLGGWDAWDVPSCVVSDGGGRASLSAQLSPMQQHINQYRLIQQRKLQEPDPEPEPEPNYFEDLAPSIERKPQMVILERPEEEQQVSNRVSISLSDPLLQTSELGNWIDEEGGWEDEAEDEDDLDAVLREKRQLEREKRKLEQMKRKAERESLGRTTKPLAAKISTKIS